MNPVAAAVTAGAMVVAGKWADGKAPDIMNGIGIAGIAIGLAVIDQANEKLAEAFGTLIVLSIAFVYLPKIVKGAGLSKG